MKKLVRDNIPDIIKNKGEECNYHVAGELEYSIELFNKLIEEALEVEKSRNKKNLIEELADIMEVIDAISEENGIMIYDIIKVKLEKRKLKGGFKERFILETENN